MFISSRFQTLLLHSSPLSSFINHNLLRYLLYKHIHISMFIVPLPYVSFLFVDFVGCSFTLKVGKKVIFYITETCDFNRGV